MQSQAGSAERNWSLDPEVAQPELVGRRVERIKQKKRRGREKREKNKGIVEIGGSAL